jgi:exopolysaccharide biosynthesis polyprenyl glycosylphosphotransferase
MNTPKRINYNLVTSCVVVVDLIVSILLFVFLKKWIPEIEVVVPKMIYPKPSTPYLIELIIFTSFWIIQMGLSGLYRQLKMKELLPYYFQFIIVLLISHILFTFIFFTKNEILFNYGFFHFFLQLYFIILAAFSIPRLVFYALHYWAMKHGKIAIHALLIGNHHKAESVYNDLKRTSKSTQYHFVGYIETAQTDSVSVHLPIPKLGSIENLQTLTDKVSVDEVIVALENDDYKTTQHVLNVIRQKNITIRILPDLTAILEGTVKVNNVEGVPLITIRNNLMPVWQIVLKTTFDYTISLLAICLTLPIIPFIVIGILTSSKGPVFYTQVRIGKHRKPFKMIKFRSMYADAEHTGPALATIGDPRVTQFGKLLRKWHIDEIPQFINVLKGDMSLVGPRPERMHYIEQILPIAPHYAHLFRIKPGITSWGMVKYGYAENIDQMVERLKFDILYLENMSFLVDLKIILHTLKSVIIGDGK